MTADSQEESLKVHIAVPFDGYVADQLVDLDAATAKQRIRDGWARPAPDDVTPEPQDEAQASASGLDLDQPAQPITYSPTPGATEKE